MFLAFFVRTSISAQNIEKAKAYEEEGKIQEAIGEYRQWLEGNTESQNYVAVALHLSDLIQEVDAKLAVLARIIDLAQIPRQKYVTLKKLASIEELTGQYKAAQAHYLAASFAIPEKKDFESLLRSALLLFELGEYGGAEAQARAIIETCKVDSIKTMASVLLSRVYYATDRKERSLETAAEILLTDFAGPATLLWIFQLAIYTEHIQLREKAISMLRENFPKSAEYGMAMGEIEYAAAPSLFLGPKFAESTDAPPVNHGAELNIQEEAIQEDDTQPIFVSIQTGSFSIRENAEYAVKDLKESGFTAVISQRVVNNTLYYRVLIPEILYGDVDKMVLILKEKGFEGFPLYGAN